MPTAINHVEQIPLDDARVKSLLSVEEITADNIATKDVECL
jgi:hypothetical protein